MGALEALSSIQDVHQIRQPLAKAPEELIIRMSCKGASTFFVDSLLSGMSRFSGEAFVQSAPLPWIAAFPLVLPTPSASSKKRRGGVWATQIGGALMSGLRQAHRFE